MSSMVRISVSVCAVFASLLFMAPLSSPAGDAPVADETDGVCETATGNVCALRAAIGQANATENEAAGPDEIRFAIPAREAVDGVFTISPGLSLPTIAESVVIDGYTQSGATPATGSAAATLKVVLDGSGRSGVGGIIIGADGGGSTVRGLVIGASPEPSRDTDSASSRTGIPSSGTISARTRRAARSSRTARRAFS